MMILKKCFNNFFESEPCYGSEVISQNR